MGKNIKTSPVKLIGGAITASFIAWRNLRSDRVEKERENK